MALRVAFVTTLGANVGDEIIREGVRAALDAAGLAYVPFYIDKHDRGSLRRPVEDEPQATTDKYWDADVVIQAGAPVYWHVLGGRSTSLNCDWAGWLWRDRVLARDGRPQPVFLNLGAGSSQPWGDTGRAFLDDERADPLRPFAGFGAHDGRVAQVAVRDEALAAVQHVTVGRRPGGTGQPPFGNRLRCGGRGARCRQTLRLSGGDHRLSHRSRGPGDPHPERAARTRAPGGGTLRPRFSEAALVWA
jgi:hypothetical protein